MNKLHLCATIETRAREFVKFKFTKSCDSLAYREKCECGAKRKMGHFATTAVIYALAFLIGTSLAIDPFFSNVRVTLPGCP
jgi:hypothetical protein